MKDLTERMATASGIAEQRKTFCWFTIVSKVTQRVCCRVTGNTRQLTTAQSLLASQWSLHYQFF